MKRILFFLILLCVEKALHAQYVYTIKADSVKITNTCDTAELIIENHTQNVPGFLYNKGRGRTEFKRVSQFNDTSVVIGGDTIYLGRGYKNFANADLAFTGDRTHNGVFQYVNLTDFGGIDLKTSNTDGNYLHELKLDTMYGIGFSTMYNYEVLNTSSLKMNDLGFNYQLDNGAINQSILKMEKNGFQISNQEYSSASTSIATSNNHETGSNDLNISDQGADLKLTNFHGGGLKYAAIYLCQGDSIVIAQGANYPSAQINTKYVQYTDRFIFRNAYTGVLDFRLYGLPASSSSADSMLVIDNNGQVKKRSQSPTRKSATVTGANYTVPADIEVVFVNYTSGQATITLPTGTLDREITIKNLHAANTVILSGLDTSESNSIATRGAITVKYTGSAWVGISKY